MQHSYTRGIHHVGLTVSRLEDSAAFFTEQLGWQRVGGNPDYPAIFVSDGTVMLTLWQNINPDTARAFDKNNNIGLHHLAIHVVNLEALDEIYKRLQLAENVRIEFAPEFLRDGPTTHMMCYEPSGNRIEFIVPA